MRHFGRAANLAKFGDAPVKLDLYLDAYEGPSWKIKPFRNRSGWLTVVEARLPMSFGTWRRTMVACVSDQGEVFASAQAQAVFDIPASLPMEVDDYEPDCLDAAMDDLQLAFMREADRNNLGFLADLNERIETKIAAYEVQCRKIENGIADAMRFLHAERRQLGVSEETLAGIDTKLARLSEMTDALGAGMRERIGAMRADSDIVEAEVMLALGQPGFIDRTTTVRWRAISRWGRGALDRPISQPIGWRDDNFGSRMSFGPLGWGSNPYAAVE